MCGGRREGSQQSRLKAFPASAGLLCKYIIKGISTEPSVAVSTSLLGQPEILLSQAVTWRLLRVLRGTPNFALCAGAKSGGEVARTRAGGPVARGGRRSVSWVSAVAGPVSGRLIASGVELGASSAQPGGHCACAHRPAPPPRTPPRVFLPVWRRPNREGRAPWVALGPPGRGDSRVGLLEGRGELRGPWEWSATEREPTGRVETGPATEGPGGLGLANFFASLNLKDIDQN